MKKIIAVLAAVFCMGIGAHADWSSDDDILVLLNSLNIMTGDQYGDYHLDDYVTRAEFAKIAVASSSAKDTVALALKVSPFSDVKYTDWFAPYVKAAVSGGLVEGYIDGSFRPYNNVSYEEAVTMLLRGLGYTADDFGDSWPYGQVGMANSLEMSKNVNASVGEAITRRQAARLVYNTLDTKQKGSASKLIEALFDCESYDSVTIIASHNEDTSVGSEKIYTTKGLIDIDETFDYDYVGRQGDMVVKNGDDFLSFTPYEQYTKDYSVTNVIGNDIIVDGQILDINENTTAYFKSQTLTYSGLAEKANTGDTLRVFTNAAGSVDYVILLQTSVNGGDTTMLDKYVIYSLLDNAVIAYKDGSFIQIDLKDTTKCYKDTTQTTYAAIKTEMEMGDIIYVKMNGSTVDYINYEKGNMTGPVMVSSSDWMDSIGADSSAKIMRDGTQVTSSSILTNDIVYYCADLNMVLAYSDKVTGIYEDASPTKDAPSTVTISGKEYGIESVEAFNTLSSSGSAKIGDTITVALGKDGEIAGVVTGESGSTTVSEKTGYMTEAGSKVMTDTSGNAYTGYYAKIVGADGVESEYEVDRDYSKNVSYVSKVVKATFENGETTISLVSSTSLSGTVSLEDYTIGSTPVSENVKILDTVANTDTSNTYDSTMYKRIYLQRLDGLNIAQSKVMYVKKNTLGEVTELILNDVTGDAYSYGIITAATGTSADSTRSYTIDIAGTARTYAKSIANITDSRSPVKLRYSDGTIELATVLQKYSGTVSSLTHTSCVINQTTYLLSDSVLVYYIDGEYNVRMITLDDAINGNYSISAYYDKTPTQGGRIRILTAKSK